MTARGVAGRSGTGGGAQASRRWHGTRSANPETALMLMDAALARGLDDVTAKRLRLLDRANAAGRHDLVIAASSGALEALGGPKVDAAWRRLEMALNRCRA
jgi:hypothetical protein